MTRPLLLLVATILHLCITSILVSYTMEQVMDRYNTGDDTPGLKKKTTRRAMTPRPRGGTMTTNAVATATTKHPYRTTRKNLSETTATRTPKSTTKQHLQAFVCDICMDCCVDCIFSLNFMIPHSTLQDKHMGYHYPQRLRRHLHNERQTPPPPHHPPHSQQQEQQQEPPIIILPSPVPIAYFTLYNSETDQPLANYYDDYPLMHQGNHWTVDYKLDLSETGRDLNINVQFNQWVDHVIYFWDGQPTRRRKDRHPPFFIGAYNDDDNDDNDDPAVVVLDIGRFFPLTVPGNHTMIARAMKSKKEILQDFTILFQVLISKNNYLERVLINAGNDDEQYLMNPERSYSFGIDHYDDPHQQQAHHPSNALDEVANTTEEVEVEEEDTDDVVNAYGVEYFQTLRKSEYRGGSNDFPILYTISGLNPSALHRITIGFLETEPAYCDPQHHFFQTKSYFIFCNGDFLDHAYNPLQYVPCDTVHLATGYFPTNDQGVLTISFLSKFYPWETTVALVDIELFQVSSLQ